MGGTICQNIKPPTLTHISSSVYTTKHLMKNRRLGYKQFLYLLYVNSLKKLFVSKTKFNCFEKIAIFSYSLLPRIFKFRRSSLRLVFLIKIVYNIVQTLPLPSPLSPFLKRGEVNFVDYLPSEEGIWKIRKRGWTGQVLLKVYVYVYVFDGWGVRGGWGLTLFVFNFFQGLSFLHIEITLPFAKLCYEFEEKFFHKIMVIYNLFVKGFKRLKLIFDRVTVELVNSPFWYLLKPRKVGCSG